ncbi:unnamed protein product [Phytophthora lilii]|uniref:Unnamed protein product n=1 Tax=Phytophthora lilii TaxID=2077276 RepID=A0A9W7D8N0_9STRA|nr:unnamed protein product [Phytophthora lilii]
MQLEVWLRLQSVDHECFAPNRRRLPTPPPLLIVTLLYRSKPAFDQLRHVIDATSAFLDTSVELEFREAVKHNSVPLLNRIWDSCLPVKGQFSRRKYLRTNVHYNRYQYRFGMENAVGEKVDMDVVRWLFNHFYGCLVSGFVVGQAAQNGNLELLQLFKKSGIRRRMGRDIRDDKGIFPFNGGIKHFVRWGGHDMIYAAKNNHPEVVWWLHYNTQIPRMHVEDVLTAAVKNEDMMMLEWVDAKYRIDGKAWKHDDNLHLVRWDIRSSAFNVSFADSTMTAMRNNFYKFVDAYKASGGVPGGFTTYRDEKWTVPEMAEYLYGGGNFDRLQKIKTVYDPTEMFNTDPQAIPALA